jgi:hypothetical protein
MGCAANAAATIGGHRPRSLIRPAGASHQTSYTCQSDDAAILPAPTVRAFHRATAALGFARPQPLRSSRLAHVRVVHAKLISGPGGDHTRLERRACRKAGGLRSRGRKTFDLEHFCLNLCRDLTAGSFPLHVVRASRAKGGRRRHCRQAQCRGRSIGGSGGAIPIPRTRV